MAETRKYTRAGRRNIINANNIISRDGEYALVCAPIGALQIARNFLRQRGLWRTSYATAYGDSEYTLPDDAAMAVIEQQIEEFLEATSNMDCNDLTSALEDIAAAINAQTQSGGCGCGSSGAGEDSPPIDDTNTGDITQQDGTPPEGYANWEVYQQAKCDIAHWIVDSMVSDMQWWVSFGEGNLTPSALAAGMLSTLPNVVLTLLYGAIVTMVGYSVGTLEDMIDALEGDTSDLVCAIMSGETAQESIDAFTDEQDTAIEASISSGIEQLLAETVAHYFADSEQFNLLYAPYEDYLAKQITTGNDCTDCGVPCSNVQMSYGENLGGGLWSSLYEASAWRISGTINSNSTAVDPCGDMESITFDEIIGHTHTGSGSNDFRISEDDSPTQIIYDSDTPPEGLTLCMRTFSFKSNTPMTVQITRNGKC